MLKRRIWRKSTNPNIWPWVWADIGQGQGLVSLTAGGGLKAAAWNHVSRLQWDGNTIPACHVKQHCIILDAKGSCSLYVMIQHYNRCMYSTQISKYWLYLSCKGWLFSLLCSVTGVCTANNKGNFVQEWPWIKETNYIRQAGTWTTIRSRKQGLYQQQRSWSLIGDRLAG